MLRSGSLSDALTDYNRSLEIYKTLAAEYPADTNLLRSISIMYSYIGYAKMEMGQTVEAVQLFGQALSGNQKLLLADPENRHLRGAVVTSDLWVGIALSSDGQADESLEHIRRSLASQTANFESDKGNFSERNSLADNYLELGSALIKKAENEAEPRHSRKGVLREAIESYTTAIANYEVVWKTDLQNFSSQRQIAFTKSHLANALRMNGDRAKALQMFEATLASFEELTQKDPNNSEWRHDLAICHLKIGEILMDSTNPTAAAPHINTARQMLESLSTRSPETLSIKLNLEAAERAISL